MSTATTTNALKEKTKAKQRYLKQKKKRRKHRKAANSTTLPHGGEAQRHQDQDDDEASDSDASTASENCDLDSKPQKVHITAPDLPRPKKRRKVDSPRASVELDEPPPEQPALDHLPNPIDTFLPSFPLPSIPDAPSASVLALQGVDKSLLDAVRIPLSTQIAIPQDEDDNGTGLSLKTRRRLKDLGISELFAVQAALLPFLLPSNPLKRGLYLPFDPPVDVCVSAPTGSGKTLAYVLPIIEILSARVVTRLRALVVLPTRDLVVQVRETFEAVGKGRGLKIAAVTGQHSFSHEQWQLVSDRNANIQGGSSKIDILICTPGRLIDHLNTTPNFTLQHLRFLVIDEADRLLTQSFQGWLAQALSSIRLSSTPNGTLTSKGYPSPDAVAPQNEYLLPYPHVSSFPWEKKVSSCQKLLFSATLTRDPGKIAASGLRDPKYFVVQADRNASDVSGVMSMVMENFTMPATLSEHMVVCESSQKPLTLFYLLHVKRVTNALVFTKSAESTTRLLNLLNFFEGALAEKRGPSSEKRFIASAYSSDLAAGERKTMLDRFKSREIDLLISSDLISRGIDISHVSHVVSYDAPVDMRKYVHRVGRTARAGKEGDAWVLIEEQEARYFKSMMRDAGHLARLRKVQVTKDDLDPFMDSYDVALDRLKEMYAR